jgi:hypothetical protein
MVRVHGNADRCRLVAAISVVLGPVTAIRDANAHSNASPFACAIRCRAQLHQSGEREPLLRGPSVVAHHVAVGWGRNWRRPSPHSQSHRWADRLFRRCRFRISFPDSALRPSRLASRWLASGVSLARIARGPQGRLQVRQMPPLPFISKRHSFISPPAGDIESDGTSEPNSIESATRCCGRPCRAGRHGEMAKANELAS